MSKLGGERNIKLFYPLTTNDPHRIETFLYDVKHWSLMC